MNRQQIMLFTTSHCAECVKVKEYIKEHKLTVEIIDAEEHAYLAIENEVMSVPTLVDAKSNRYVGSSKSLEFLKGVH